MRKRIRKKYHKEYLASVVCAVSLSKYWRKKLFTVLPSDEYIISLDNLEGMDNELGIVLAIKRYKLRYSIRAYRDVEFDSTYVYIKIQAVDFPDIESESYNNSKVL